VAGEAHASRVFASHVGGVKVQATWFGEMQTREDMHRALCVRESSLRAS
jgi:hypothetical protein